jgi:hypothetical protein
MMAPPSVDDPEWLERFKVRCAEWVADAVSAEVGDFR